MVFINTPWKGNPNSFLQGSPTWDNNRKDKNLAPSKAQYIVDIDTIKYLDNEKVIVYRSDQINQNKK